jgi:transposase
MYRRYDKQFKEQTLKLVTEQGRDATSTARELGIPHSTLFKWLEQIGWQKPVDANRPVPLPDDPAKLKARILELELQVKRLQTDQEILKKATAFFAKQSP